MTDRKLEARRASWRRYDAQNREKRSAAARTRYAKLKAEGRVPKLTKAQKTLRNEYRKRNLERFAKAQKSWYHRNKARARAVDRKHRGLPEAARAEPKVCECCGSPPRKYGLNLDHCHSTGVFRGWLCPRCNMGIGALGDNISGLKRAITYLERHAKAQG